MVQILLRVSDYRIKNIGGKTPLDCLSNSTNTEIHSLFRSAPSPPPQHIPWVAVQATNLPVLPKMEEIVEAVSTTLNFFTETLNTDTTILQPTLTMPPVVNSFLNATSTGPTAKATAALLTLDHLTAASNRAQSTLEKRATEVDEQIGDIEERRESINRVRGQIIDLRKQLAEKEEILSMLQEALISDQEKLSDCQKSLSVAENLCTQITEAGQAMRIEADIALKTNADLMRATQVHKTKIVRNFEEVGELPALSTQQISMILRDIGLSAYVQSFEAQGIDGLQFNKITDQILDGLGVTKLLDRKLLMHTSWLLRHTGYIRVSPPLAVAMTETLSNDLNPRLVCTWSPTVVHKWLESQKLPYSICEQVDLPGWALLHLTEKDLLTLGVPLPAANSLLFKVKDLAKAVLETLSGLPLIRPDYPEYICPLSRREMENPVFASDWFLYDHRSIQTWLETHNTSPLIGTPISKEIVPCTTLRSDITLSKRN
ncbi:hypothetical protein Pelo_12621 [Pelomyxa schiedti]|nr:hypothetical protein Pelo_12621 [Pelomyxa schiedti]